MQPDLIISFILFIVVGIIVSMDVVGMTLSKTEDFYRRLESPLGWSLINAIWHAVMLGAYLLIISGILKLSPDLLDFLKSMFEWIWKVIPYLPTNLLSAFTSTFRSIEEHLQVILGLVGLIVVWKTYSEKIVHQNKPAKLYDLPLLSRFVFDIFDLIIRATTNRRLTKGQIARKIFNHLQAALVAIDMLALALLLKSIGYIDNPTQGIMAVTVILLVVFSVTMLATNYCIWQLCEIDGKVIYSRYPGSGRKVRSPFIASKNEYLNEKDVDAKIYKRKAWEWVRVTLRLMEPFLIFYFALQLVSMLVLGRQTHGISLYLGSFLLVGALIHRWGLGKIIKSALASAPSLGDKNIEPIRGLPEIRKDAWQFLIFSLKAIIVIFLSVCAFSVWIWIRYRSPIESISLDAELSWFLTLLGVCSAGALFLRPHRFERFEKTLIGLLQTISNNRRTYVYMAAALIVAVISPVYGDIIDKLSHNGATFSFIQVAELFGENHKHALQVALWLAYLFVIAVLIDLAQELFKKNVGNIHAIDQDIQDQHLRELYGALITICSVLLVGIGWIQENITT